MDLTRFCGDEPSRQWMATPFSRGDWTYATNGHVLVRTPRRTEAPLLEVKANVEKPFADYPCSSFGALPAIDVPEVGNDDDCDHCSGRGHVHDCPDCTCVCSACDGNGQAVRGAGISVEIGEACVAAPYYLLLASLPGIEVGPQKSGPTDPIPFRFEGGEGRLMPLRGRLANHISAKVE